MRYWAWFACKLTAAAVVFRASLGLISNAFPEETDAFAPLGKGLNFLLCDLALMVWFLLAAVESIVALRVLFRALASREEGFVRFVYTISVPLVAPFRPIVPDQVVGKDGRRVVEVSSLIAMLLLFLGAYLLVTLIGIVTGPPG